MALYLRVKHLHPPRKQPSLNLSRGFFRFKYKVTKGGWVTHCLVAFLLTCVLVSLQTCLLVPLLQLLPVQLMDGLEGRPEGLICRICLSNNIKLGNHPHFKQQ